MLHSLRMIFIVVLALFGMGTGLTTLRWGVRDGLVRRRIDTRSPRRERRWATGSRAVVHGLFTILAGVLVTFGSAWLLIEMFRGTMR